MPEPRQIRRVLPRGLSARAALIWAIGYGALLARVAVAAEPPRVRIHFSTGQAVVLAQPVVVRVSGLTPRAEATLTAELRDREGGAWRSAATFLADGEGAIDLARDAPSSGSWSGADAAGPFWSMRPVEAGVEAGGGVPDRQSPVFFEVEVDGEVVASETLLRWHFHSGILTQEIRVRGMVGTFYSPPAATGSLPGIIVLGGSGGGIAYQERAASLLASAGFATLALAYFDMPDLPASLERIPLEYCQAAVDWLQEHPVTNPEAIGVVGVSKGGELALLLGSRFPEIRAVVAWVGSSVVFQSIAPQWPQTSSWAWQGQELPFVPYATGGSFAQSGKLVDLYNDSLDDEEAVAAAAIPVERINGPVLLFSGQDDTLWPATRMSEQLVERWNAHDRPFPIEHVAFPDAGHSIARLPYFPGLWSTGLGGTPRGVAHAQIESWKRLPSFLVEALVSRSADGPYNPDP